MSDLIAGRYDVHSCLGQGAMGEVFLATDTLLRRKVAIKRIRSTPGSGTDQTALARLRREAQAAAVVHHPNVVTIHDLVSEDDLIYIVMEYVEGRTLADLIRDGTTLDPLTVAKIGTQVAAALEAAHQVSVIHRDVKPANILLADASGTAKLADFGIARSLGDTSLTGTGLLIGSLAYMAPEVANGGRATAASDVYSLGSTLFAATEGNAPFTPPFRDATPAQLLARLLREPAPPARKAGPLTGLIARMLAVDPAERPTAAEVRLALNTLTPDGGPSEHSTTAEPQPSGDSRSAYPRSEPSEVGPFLPLPAWGDSPQVRGSEEVFSTLVVTRHEPPEGQMNDQEPLATDGKLDATRVEHGSGTSAVLAPAIVPSLSARRFGAPMATVHPDGPSESAGRASRSRRGALAIGATLGLVATLSIAWVVASGTLGPVGQDPARAVVATPTASMPGLTSASTTARETANNTARAGANPAALRGASVALGGYSSCALTSGGGVKCWGDNQFGELGDGTTTNRSKPVDVVGLGSGVTTIATSGNSFCALTSSGAVKCWGWNLTGELGDGTTTDRTTPVDVVGLGSRVTAIAVGSGHACAIVGGGVKCWGNNVYGALGDGTRTQRSTPVDVVGLGSGVKAIGAGDLFSCALTEGGAVKCWGYNTYHQLGDGSVKSQSVPVDVSGLGAYVTAIDVGDNHACALTTSGSVSCWGNNEAGLLGDGTTTPRATPVQVSGLASGVKGIAVGGFTACALRGSSTPVCWGDTDMNLFNNAVQLTPAKVEGLGTDVTEIDISNAAHACARTSTGTLKCWGHNGYGQLGDGSLVFKATPVTVPNLSS